MCNTLNKFFFLIFFLKSIIFYEWFSYIKYPPYTFLYCTSMSGGYTNLTSPITQPVGSLPPAQTLFTNNQILNHYGKESYFQ